MDRIANNPDTVHTPVGNYSHAVRIESADAVWIWISGQVALDHDGNLVGEGDMAAQTDAVMRNLEAVLAGNGATFHHVVKVTTFVTDISRLAEVREVRGRYMQGDPPASTLVEVSALAMPGLLLEVEAVAVVSK
jgi:reactive intermediate/imine deaminase